MSRYIVNGNNAETFGIYADDDASSDHLSYIDNIFLIPGSGPSCYTNIKSIIKVLKENKIQKGEPLKKIKEAGLCNRFCCKSTTIQ